jgi:hypothetical protein
MNEDLTGQGLVERLVGGLTAICPNSASSVLRNMDSNRMGDGCDSVDVKDTGYRDSLTWGRLGIEGRIKARNEGGTVKMRVHSFSSRQGLKLLLVTVWVPLWPISDIQDSCSGSF